MRVIAPDVGGGFGSKIFVYPEEVAVCWASKQLGRPVKWTAERRESFMTDAHGRDHITEVEMAVDREGKIVALRVHTNANLGAYLSTFAPLIPTFLYGPLLSGAYKIPEIYCEVVGSLTNTTPVDAYRGAGRPEATYLLERMCDLTAKAIGMDVAEFRRKNLVPASEFPYQTPVAFQYDSGNYEPALDRALQMVDYRKLRADQEAARKEGRYLGDRLRDLHRGLRPGALRGGRRARRPGGSLGERAGARHPDREGHGLHGLPQPRPGARDDLRPAGRRRAAGAVRGRRDRPRRHRLRALRHGHLRQPLGRGGRLRDLQRRREDQGEGQEDRRASPRGERGRHRVPGGQVRRPGLARTRQDLRRGRAHGVPRAQPPEGPRAGPRGDVVLGSGQLRVPVRDPHRGRRGQRQDGQGEAPAVRGGGRRGARDQPDDRGRHGPRGDRPGRRPGALRVRGLRRRTASSRAAA